MKKEGSSQNKNGGMSPTSLTIEDLDTENEQVSKNRMKKGKMCTMHTFLLSRTHHVGQESVSLDKMTCRSKREGTWQDDVSEEGVLVDAFFLFLQ